MIPEEAGRQYPSEMWVRTHAPPKRDASSYRDCLRLEFRFACVYCLMLGHELRRERYGGFEIEHFRPKGRREFEPLRDSYANLFWACRACNRAKHDRWPTREELDRGERFLNPCDDVMAEHLRIDGQEIEALTAAGEFMIEQLGLDEPLHEQRRTDRLKAASVLTTIEMLLDNPIDGVDEILLRELRSEVELKRFELGIGGPPRDALSVCACGSQRELF